MANTMWHLTPCHLNLVPVWNASPEPLLDKRPSDPVDQMALLKIRNYGDKSLLKANYGGHELNSIRRQYLQSEGDPHEIIPRSVVFDGSGEGTRSSTHNIANGNFEVFDS